MSYPSDVSDEQWEFLVSHLTLMPEDAPQRESPSERCSTRCVTWSKRAGRGGTAARFPPGWVVYQQVRRWCQAGVFETIVHDLRIIARMLADRAEQPSAVILDARTLPSTPGSGSRAGYDAAKKKKGSKIHAAVDTLGNLLALKITAANEQERAQVEEPAEQVQEVTGGTVEVAYVDQGYTGQAAAEGARRSAIELQVVRHWEAKQGFVLLPRR